MKKKHSLCKFFTRKLSLVLSEHHAVLFRVWSLAPTNIVWLLWVFGGRRSLRILQVEPRECAYHMHSYAHHIRRMLSRARKKSSQPTAFGLNMRAEFEKGISTKIYLSEMPNWETIISSLQTGAKRLVRLEHDLIDLENIYCMIFTRQARRTKLHICFLRNSWTTC